MLQNIRIVLVETSHTGNMGSVARAMKTMGLTNLWLVNPLVKPDSQAIALAAGASDVIGNAQIVDTWTKRWRVAAVVGTSARSRTLPWPMLDPRECGLKSVSEAEQAPVALVFGRERVGLTNDELQKCHYHVAIAANPEYSSLNGDGGTGHCLRSADGGWRPGESGRTERRDRLSAGGRSGALLWSLEQTLLSTGFIREGHPGQVMNKLRRLFTRARPESRS